MSAALSERWSQLTGRPFMAMSDNVERRKHRRHDLELLDLPIESGAAEGDLKSKAAALGTVVDLSAGGIRFKAVRPAVQTGSQIRVKLELPNFAGICPFIDHENDAKPTTQWSGWMHVTRVARRRDGQYDVAGRLMDMNDVDRGMLGLYLSTQPMAA